MEHETLTTSNGGTETPRTASTAAPKGGATPQTAPFSDDSACSTPYASAPSSPGRGAVSGFYHSAPATPMHFTLASSPSGGNLKSARSFEFELSGSGENGSEPTMSSADELFLNGQIRPMTLLTRLDQPRGSAPSRDSKEDGNEINGGKNQKIKEKCLRRRTRSMSPFRNATTQFDFELNEDDEENHVTTSYAREDNESAKDEESASSSSPSSSRSKRWVFLKDFLRSKSEGRSNNKLWPAIAREKRSPHQNLLNSASKEKNSNGPRKEEKKKKKKKASAGSTHEKHYAAKRAQAEEMKKRTYLPYRPGLLGCLGFSSKGYGAASGFASALNPVSLSSR